MGIYSYCNVSDDLVFHMKDRVVLVHASQVYLWTYKEECLMLLIFMLLKLMLLPSHFLSVLGQDVAPAESVRYPLMII